MSEITGKMLLDALLIDGERVDWDSNFTNQQIYTALENCRETIYQKRRVFDIKRKAKEITLSLRQYHCAEVALINIMNEKYNQALHEFQDCICDYGNGEKRALTTNETILYSCIINCFMEKIKTPKNTNKKKPIKVKVKRNKGVFFNERLYHKCYRRNNI